MIVSMQIKKGYLEHPSVQSLLEQHHTDMNRHSPPKSVHALDLSDLAEPDISFWTVWMNEQLAGCGAVKQLSTTHAEIKSMRTSNLHRRKGVASILLKHLILQADKGGATRISLETGTMDAFIPAQELYKAFGFQPCGPFADYIEDPYSMFMTKTID
jgi:putative acetyltransferase